MNRRDALKWIGTAAAAAAVRPASAWVPAAQAQTAAIDWAARGAARPAPRPGEAVITAVGDMIVSEATSGRPAPEVQSMHRIMREADVAFGNCEQPVATVGFLAQHFAQMAPPPVLDDFRAGGFSMLSIANNHSLDLGEPGLLQWIDEAKKRGFAIAGGGRTLAEATTPAVMTAKGQRIGMLAFWCAPEDFDAPDFMEASRARAGKSGIAVITGARVAVPGAPTPLLLPHAADLRTMTEAVKRARAQVDFLMVSFHQHWNDGTGTLNAGGAQTSLEPPTRAITPADMTSPRNQVAEGRRLICRAAVDAGADLIVGHGPHVLNGIEIYKTKPIIYSLGHFYMGILKNGRALPEFRFNPSMVYSVQNNWFLEEHRWAGIARVFVRGGRVTRLQVVPVYMDVQKDGFPYLPADADSGRINTALREMSRPFRTEVRTSGWYSEVAL